MCPAHQVRRRGALGDHGEHRGEALFILQRDPGRRQLSPFHRILAAEFGQRLVAAVRIEGAQHAVDRRVDQDRIGDGIDVVEPDVVEHGREGLQLFVRRALLRGERRGGAKRGEENGDSPGIRAHGVLLSGRYCSAARRCFASAMGF